ncbi:MAG: sigma-70 family RNA polymerase sigma factor [Rhodothermus sp.]|nr:sigma-70 family RNA polymerase sigma factor [Rhodothermus sp.]
MDRSRLRVLAAQLSFHLDDQQAVEALYERWRTAGHEDAWEQLEIWLYCFIWRYFLAKATNHPDLSRVELEALVGETFLRLRGQLDTIRQASRLIGWVGISCRNAFRNYLRSVRRRPSYEPDDPPLEAPEAEQHLWHHDLSQLIPQLSAAIDRLPPFLREVTRMALLQQLPYQEISRRLNKPPGTIRVYLSRAFQRLRKDPGLADFLGLL